MVFTVNTGITNINQEGDQLSIGFHDCHIPGKDLFVCRGSVFIEAGDVKYWLYYRFCHTGNWQKITSIRVTAMDDIFSKKKLMEFGKAIAYLINHYLSTSN